MKPLSQKQSEAAARQTSYDALDIHSKIKLAKLARGNSTRQLKKLESQLFSNQPQKGPR